MAAGHVVISAAITPNEITNLLPRKSSEEFLFLPVTGGYHPLISPCLLIFFKIHSLFHLEFSPNFSFVFSRTFFVLEENYFFL